MNNIKRKQIKRIVSELTVLELELESMSCDEQISFDNLPEGIQESEKGITLEENIETLDDACETIADIIKSLELL